MARLLAHARTLIDWMTASLLAVIAALTLASVVARYLFSYSLPWSEELLRLLFVWLIMLGAARASHIRIDILENALSAGVRRRVRLFNAAVGLSLLALMLFYGIDLLRLTAYDRFTALNLSVQWLYWALMAGGAIWMITIVGSVVAEFRSGAERAE